MKSTFRGEHLTNALSELLQGLFLQALPKSVKLHLVGKSNSSSNNLAKKADPIFLELIPNNVSTVTSPDVSSFIPSTSSTNKSSGSDCFNPRDVPDLYWYHPAHGPVNARKCHGKPCPMFPCLQVSKKRVKWLATTLSRKPHDLFFVQDNLSGMKFLVDSCSMDSIIPLSAATVTVSDKPSSNNLFALNNAEIKTFGKCMLSVDIGLKGYPRIDWSFVVTDSNIAILCAYFLSAHNLMIDLKSKRFIEQDNYASEEFDSNIKFDFIFKLAPEIVFENQCTNPELYSELVNDYSNLLTFNAPASYAAINVRHVIKTHGEPVRSKVRRLSPEMLKVAKKEIDSLLEAKIIRRGISPWDSPIHLVKKKQPGQYRLTVDLRALNAVTEHDSYHLPYLNDFTNSLHGCKIFSLIDLKNAFY